jgi:TRAP transporter TAXI family solute receptor
MKRKSNWLNKLALTGLLIGLVVGLSGVAGAKGLPKQFAWTAYGTTSSGYAVSVAIGNALSEEGYKLRVIPAKNDISRMTPLKVGRVQFSAMGVGSYLAQEGVLDFGAPRWGPQPVRLVMMSWADVNVAVVATAKDANIRSSSDMRGKKIAFVKGGPALNQNMTAWLAHGGLGWNDVKKVEVGGWKASIQGIIDGNIDAAIASTNSSMLHQVAGSPRGLHFFPAPHSDKAAWKRLNTHAPWFAPHTATAGVGLTKTNTLEGASYGYPILITYDRQDSDAVYDLVKLLHTKFDSYKKAHSSGPGWAMEKQAFSWIIPYDEGSVRYFKEIGVWNSKHEANNQQLLKRQGVLQAAWKATKRKKSGGSDYLAFWLKERASALRAAGMDPVWEN